MSLRPVRATARRRVRSAGNSFSDPVRVPAGRPRACAPTKPAIEALPSSRPPGLGALAARPASCPTAPVASATPAALPAPRRRTRPRPPTIADAADARVRAREAAQSQARRGRIAAASAALDSITTGLMGGSTSAGVPPRAAQRPLARLASSALWVGRVRASVPSAVVAFPDRLEFDFLYPRRGASVRMCMRFADMTSLAVGGRGPAFPAAAAGSGRSRARLANDPRASSGTAWLAFSVAGGLRHFAGDSQAEHPPPGAAGRVLVELGVLAALGVIESDVLPRAPGLRRLWPRQTEP